MIYREGLGRPLSWAELDSNFKSVDDIGQSAQAAATSARTDATIAATAQSAATASAVTAGASAATAKAEADRASQIAGLDTVADAVGLCNAPFPDVWIPFSDSLRMIAGYGENIQVGGETVTVKATFSRASTATYIDKSGVLRTAAINEPRFEKEGLLIEGQSTNLHPNSMPIVGSNSWIKGTAATWSNDGIGPDGQPCLKVIGMSNAAISVTGASLYDNSPISVPAGTYTASVWVKLLGFTAGSPNFKLRVQSAVNNETTFTLDSVGKWVRLSCQVECDGNTRFVLGTTTSVNIIDCEIACVQIEALPFASSYIPTSGAAATRAADYCYADSLLNHLPMSETEEQTFSVTFDKMGNVRDGGNTSLYQNVFQTSRNYNLLRVDGTNLRHYRSGGAAFTMTISNNTPYVAAWKITSGNKVSASVNGSMKATDFVGVPSAGYGTVTRLWFGSATASDHVFGHIRNFRIWHRALTDAQLKSLR